MGFAFLTDTIRTLMAYDIWDSKEDFDITKTRSYSYGFSVFDIEKFSVIS
jgi:hypothetical protein